MPKGKIVFTGAAGLVGQNLLPRLRDMGFADITGIDKHPTNVEILRRYNPTINVIHADLATQDGWQDSLEGCTTLVIGHAQIGGIVHDEFIRNNVDATERLLKVALEHKIPYIVHISSSVVNSQTVDDYTETKKEQERLVDACSIPHVVLRPTLMFGWFDRKHVGWLARFMERTPVFPIPGTGRYLRQPLYAGDFANIIASAIDRKITGAYNISGQTKIDYIDLIRQVKEATGSSIPIIRIPYGIFWLLLRINALWDSNPAFTTKQLQALVTPDIFEVIDWPGIFGVPATPLKQALEVTFRDPVYSKIVLDF
jgi:nucleoside-diphosphate-sugar epimerase